MGYRWSMIIIKGHHILPGTQHPQSWTLSLLAPDEGPCPGPCALGCHPGLPLAIPFLVGEEFRRTRKCIWDLEASSAQLPPEGGPHIAYVCPNPKKWPWSTCFQSGGWGWWAAPDLVAHKTSWNVGWSQGWEENSMTRGPPSHATMFQGTAWRSPRILNSSLELQSIMKVYWPRVGRQTCF